VIGKRSLIIASCESWAAAWEALAHLGEFLYYQNKREEAEAVLARAYELGHDSGDASPYSWLASCKPRRAREKNIDRFLFRAKPAEIIDGDEAYWLGGIFAMLGERHGR